MENEFDHEVLRLKDGRVLDKDGKVTHSTKINRAFNRAKKSRAEYDGATHRRYLDDLPLPALQTRPHAIVLAYSLFGLVDADIASVLRVELEQVEEIKESQAYESMLDAMLHNIREHDKNAIRKKMNKEAENAADMIATLSRAGKKEEVRLRASQDILDRTGHKVQDKPKNEDTHGITVRILDDRETKTNIDVDVGLGAN